MRGGVGTQTLDHAAGSAAPAQALDQLIQAAFQHQRAGQYALAEPMYRKVLREAPDHLDATFLLGIVCSETGRNEMAVDLIAKAVALEPGIADFHAGLGNAQKNCGDHAAAAKSFQRALELDPKNYQAYSHYLELALNRKIAFEGELPDILLRSTPFIQGFQVEITTDCNLKCGECPRTLGINEGTWNNRHMPVEEFRKIVANAPASQLVILQGVGEPTLHPQMHELVTIARASGKFNLITFNTNGLARSMPYYEKLRDAGLTTISLSVDSLTQEIADRCRHGTKVEKLKTRVQQLKQVFPQMVVTLVASKMNFDDIPVTLRWLNAAGQFAVEIQPMIDFRPGAGASNSLSRADLRLLTGRLLAMRDEIPRIQLVNESMSNQPAADRKRCGKPFYSPYVMVDGSLTPCCVLYDKSIYGHTSLLETGIEAAWDSPAISGWHRSYIRESPKVCTGCCFNPETFAD
jgi:MoaA/NifB/PqqE/SkfB family radical SAM enzyme